MQSTYFHQSENTKVKYQQNLETKKSWFTIKLLNSVCHKTSQINRVFVIQLMIVCILSGITDMGITEIE